MDQADFCPWLLLYNGSIDIYGPAHGIEDGEGSRGRSVVVEDQGGQRTDIVPAAPGFFEKFPCLKALAEAGVHVIHIEAELTEVIYRSSEVDRLQPVGAQGRTHPEGAAWQHCPQFPPERLQLCGRCETGAHQLDLIEDPKAVVVEKSKVDGPPEAAHGVAAVEGTGKKLVLGADENGIPLGVAIP